MGTVLLDFGSKYAKVWVSNDEQFYSLENLELLRPVRCQLWMNKGGNHFIGEYDERQSEITGEVYDGFECSLDILYNLLFFPEEPQIRNFIIGEKALLNPTLFLAHYEEIMKIFFDELLNHVLSTANVGVIDKVVVIRSGSLLDHKNDFYAKKLDALFSVAFVSRSEVVAHTYGIRTFGVNEAFIVIDLGESHSDFIVAKKNSDESITEMRIEHCEIGGQYIDILIYNYVISQFKSNNPDGAIDLQMKQCELAKRKIKTGTVLVNRRFNISLRPEAYQKLSKPYVRKIISFVRRNLELVELDEIRNVFVLGGSSKVAEVEEELRKIFVGRLIMLQQKYYERKSCPN